MTVAPPNRTNASIAAWFSGSKASPKPSSTLRMLWNSCTYKNREHARIVRIPHPRAHLSSVFTLTIQPFLEGMVQRRNQSSMSEITFTDVPNTERAIAITATFHSCKACAAGGICNGTGRKCRSLARGYLPQSSCAVAASYWLASTTSFPIRTSSRIP